MVKVSTRLTVLVLALATSPAGAETAACGKLAAERTIKHDGKDLSVWSYSGKDGRVATIVANDMRVNADGAVRAYAAYGQHGLSYLCDGALVAPGRGEPVKFIETLAQA